MKKTIFLICFTSTLTAFAADPSSRFNSTVLKPIPLTESERMELLITPKRDAPVIRLGKSDFVFGGPLVQGFRRLPPGENLSRGQRFLRLPIIRWFVPGPMENPPGGTGKYFAWRNEDCSLSWPQAASRPEIMKGPR